mmetsp:Transcript_2139/g.5431  ORF Transcript_2139/g.5431 Transcript_2139/m.5431 type:complete len:248 (+) Transcript_2139:783-1526(+)
MRWRSTPRWWTWAAPTSSRSRASRFAASRPPQACPWTTTCPTTTRSSTSPRRCATRATASTRWRASTRTHAPCCWRAPTASWWTAAGTPGSTTRSSRSSRRQASPSPPPTTARPPRTGLCLARPRAGSTRLRRAGGASRALERARRTRRTSPPPPRPSPLCSTARCPPLPWPAHRHSGRTATLTSERGVCVATLTVPLLLTCAPRCLLGSRQLTSQVKSPASPHRWRAGAGPGCVRLEMVCFAVLFV